MNTVDVYSLTRFHYFALAEYRGSDICFQVHTAWPNFAVKRDFGQATATNHFCNYRSLLLTTLNRRKAGTYLDKLAKKSFELLDDSNSELKVLEDVPNDLVPLYLNASDVVLLTSRWEGSPNVIKEAMACNRPILSTNVGDVSCLLSNVKGCNIVEVNVQDIAEKIKNSIEQYSMSDGREKVKELKIDSRNVAKKIIQLYINLKYGK